MSVAKVLRLDDHRDRRAHRLEVSRALSRPDPSRRALFDHLGKIAVASGADRVATVWVDEYGPGLVHPHAVLDLLSDRPRRHFDVMPLQRAWEFGVPGTHDEVLSRTATGPSTFAVALGSDGARAWFVVADSVTARPVLDETARDRVMFLAGECSAVALHRDLGAPNGEEHRFAGWHILRDLEGREADEAEGRRIAQRFIVARLVRNLLDDDLVISPERLLEQVERTRAELTKDDDLDPDELRLWEMALVAYGAVEIVTLADAMAELGRLAEERGHHHGAEEMYGLSYGLAVAVSEVGVAAEAARALGRVHRRQASRDTAALWYEGAREMATVAGLDATAALSVSGLATLTRERGNLPAARALLDEALEFAERSGDRSTLVTIHRDAVSLEHSAGNMEDALHHAWMAVGASAPGKERAQSLASLAGSLERAGDYELATDAWKVVAETSDELYLKVFAYDAMAHICALRGDEPGFERYAAQCDALGYESLPSACSQILHYRGLSLRALARFEEAESWLERAVAFADEHGFNETLFRAEKDLLELPSYVAERVENTPAAPAWVRDGVQAMRRELVGGAV